MSQIFYFFFHRLRLDVLWGVFLFAYYFRKKVAFGFHIWSHAHNYTQPNWNCVYICIFKKNYFNHPLMYVACYSFGMSFIFHLIGYLNSVDRRMYVGDVMKRFEMDFHHIFLVWSIRNTSVQIKISVFFAVVVFFLQII